MKPIQIFIGYDEVESVAFHAMHQSILNNTTVPVSVTGLKLSMLPMYTRERDPKQSNEFSFTRFLVPYLMGYEGHAIYADLDMLVRADLNELWKLRDNSSVQVVKHDYTPKTQVKYLGAIQYRYPRKNWSSVMLFNCQHDHCKRLTPDYVNNADGLALHRFYWTHDRDIGTLDKDWNHLVGEYQENPNAKIAHYTLGGPWFNEYSEVEFGYEWDECITDVLYCKQIYEAKEA